MLVGTMRLNQITLPALDVAESLRFYQRLGLVLVVDALPRYARLENPEDGQTLSLHHTAAVPARGGVVLYFESPSADALDAQVAQLQQHGLVFDQAPRDEPWGWREARLRDPAGLTVCVYHAGAHRRHPPWRVESSAPHHTDPAAAP